MTMPSNVKLYTNNFMGGHETSKTASAIVSGKVSVAYGLVVLTPH